MSEMYSRKSLWRGALALLLSVALLIGVFLPKNVRAGDGSDSLGEFVTRAYQLILDREPEEAGFAYWYDSLTNGERTAANLINEFIISREMTDRNLPYDEQIDILYHVMFDRDADDAGKKYWLDYMDEGFSISSVVDGFTRSQEFVKVCEKFGITPGHVDPVENRDKNKGVTRYVSRVYMVIL